MTTKALATHTPGPWDVGTIFSDKVSITGQFNGQTIRLADIPDVLSSDSEEMANARLMAAAPELLKALQKLSLWCDENINGVPSELARIQELADDAILKAKGKP